jgi:hypothetical protein
MTESGSFAALAAIRRASSLISGLAEGLRRNSFRCATVRLKGPVCGRLYCFGGDRDCGGEDLQGLGRFLS